MKNIDTATPKEISDYLQYLYNIAWEKSNHKKVAEIWKNLYDFVFSDEISRKLSERFGRLNYYDPDASYYEDVTAYIEAFSNYANRCTSSNNVFPSFEEYQNNKKYQYE